MSLVRRAAKRDDSEPGIVKALRRRGVSVDYVSGKGKPDLDCGYRGKNHKIECKTGNEGLNEDQRKWHDAWRGEKPSIVRNEAQADKLVTMWDLEFASDQQRRASVEEDLSMAGALTRRAQ